MIWIFFILVAFRQSDPADENLEAGVTPDGPGFPIDFAT